MAFNQTADGIEIIYVEVPPALRDAGVTTGTTLVRGKWDDTVLVGEAFAFHKGCPPIAYPVRGVVDRSGALIVIGPLPTSCTGREYAWDAGSVMRFDPGGRDANTETRPAKTKVKARERSRPKPRAAPVRRQPQPQWQQWRWW